MMKSTGVLSTLRKIAASAKRMAKPRRKKSQAELEAWQQRCYELARENERLKFEAQESRAQLCQLRIDGGAYGDQLRKRIGYMIGTFIPEGALEKLRAHPDRVPEFKRHILEAMVDSAINKMLYVNEQGKQVAMLFLPAGQKGAGRANLPVFESNKAFQITVPEQLQREINLMLEDQAKEERRKLLQY